MSMIQCPNCKSMVDNSGAFCPNCGTPIAAAPEAPVQPVQAQPSQPVYVAAPVPERRGAHGCSIAGFVCGLLGLIFCWTYIGLLAIPGLILSIVGMSQKNRSKGLGENDPEMMWLTTMNPETRRLIRVMPEDADETARVFDLLLGDNLAGRKEHIAEVGSRYLDLADLS